MNRLLRLLCSPAGSARAVAPPHVHEAAPAARAPGGGAPLEPPLPERHVGRDVGGFVDQRLREAGGVELNGHERSFPASPIPPPGPRGWMAATPGSASDRPESGAVRPGVTLKIRGRMADLTYQ